MKENFFVEKQFQIKKKDILIFFLVFLLKIILDFSYYFIVYPLWGYFNFWLKINFFKLFESYFYLFFIFFFLPKEKKFSNLIIWILFFFSFLPFLTLFAFEDQPRIFVWQVLFFWLFLLILLIILRSFNISFKKTKKNQAIFLISFLFFFLTVFFIFAVFRHFNFSLKLKFDIGKIYEIRNIFFAKNFFGSKYISYWYGYFVCPFLFAFFLKRKKWFFVSLIIFLEILIFLNTGIKIFLLILPFIVFLFWVFKKKNFIIRLSTAINLILLLSTFSFYFFNDKITFSVLVVRNFFIPAQLSFFYYDFFSKNGYTFFSQHHLFDALFQYPYELKPYFLISSIYFPYLSDIMANNGLYGDPYMNFGFLGFLFWAIFFVIIFKLIDVFSKNKQNEDILGIIASIPFILINSPLLTSFFSMGFWLSFLILYLLPKNNYEKDLSSYNCS